MTTTTIDPFDDIPASPPEINPEKQKEIAAPHNNLQKPFGA